MCWHGCSGVQKHKEQSALIVTKGREEKREGPVSQTSLQEDATKDVKATLQIQILEDSWPTTMPPCTPGLWHMGFEGAVNMKTTATSK